MVTRALVVNLGNVIQNNPIITDLFTDHEKSMHKWRRYMHSKHGLHFWGK